MRKGHKHPYKLPKSELAALREDHARLKNKKGADRIKAVYLLGSGWTIFKVAEALLVDPKTVVRYYQRYIDTGVEGLLEDCVGGSDCWLSDEQLRELEIHLQENLYTTAAEVCEHVRRQYRVKYSVRGMTNLLHRLGFVFKKTRLVPGKADPEAQELFVETYENLKENKELEDPIYFVDATHPQHNSQATRGWIKRGEEYEIPTNTGRKRLNINGAINIETLQPTVLFDDTINAQSAIELFKTLEDNNPQAGRIYVICDNARYYKSTLVQEWLSESKVTVIYLPPYSPNLNLIERFWKFFKKKILYGHYYETFEHFKWAREDFFDTSEKYLSELQSLITENFEIVGDKHGILNGR